jgi:acetyl-CoA decarbonylase/synthase complex subunit gamma
MALSGLDIYKLLPASSKDPAVKAHANCKECGFPTCLAFAMKLAAKQAELAQCPYVTQESKAQLSAAATPPIRLITLSADGRKIEVGNETVLFRHEKTFYHPTGLLVRVADTLSEADIAALTKAVADYQVDYVGMLLRLDGLVVEDISGDAGKFAAATAAARGAATLPLALATEDPTVMAAGLAKAGGTAPLIVAATEANWEAMAKLAVEHKAPLAVRAGSIEALAALTEKLNAAGVEDLVLAPTANDFVGSLTTLTQLRRLALKTKPVGYPITSLTRRDADLEGFTRNRSLPRRAGGAQRFDPALVYPLLFRANSTPIRRSRSRWSRGSTPSTSRARAIRSWSPPTSRSRTSLSQTNWSPAACQAGCW